jgi:Rieske 2Fe-2S family protein
MNNDPRSAKGAYGLEGRAVTDPNIFDTETEKIFERNWICVGRTTDLDPNSNCLPVEIENHLLLVVRSSDGLLKCFHNICRHRGSRLVDEHSCSKVGSKIACPYHAWAYDRDGNLVSAPNMTETEGFDRNDFGLKEVACREWEGFIWINHQGSNDFEAFIGTLSELVKPWGIGELKTHATIEYVVAANWKLIFQNYSECYHCPSVHPALNRLTPYKDSTNDLESGPILGGPMKLAADAKTMSMDGVAVGQILPGLDQEQSRTIAYYTISPTMFLSVHPDYVLVHRLERWAIDQTRVVCEFLFHPESMATPGFSAQPAIKFWDMTNRQDWRVCELAQMGMSSDGYEPGPYSNLESVVAAFDQHYQASMNG